MLLNGFLRRSPDGPKDIAATGIDEADLLALLMKLIYCDRLEKVGQCADAIKLPQSIVMDLAKIAIKRQLLYTLGAHSSDTMMETRYALTDEGTAMDGGCIATVGIRRSSAGESCGFCGAGEAAETDQ